MDWIAWLVAGVCASLAAFFALRRGSPRPNNRPRDAADAAGIDARRESLKLVRKEDERITTEVTDAGRKLTLYEYLRSQWRK